MGIRKTIVSRIAIVYFVLLLFGAVVVFKMISVQQIKNEKWQKIEANLSKNTIIVEPNRGNICADDGSVLATSVPGYYVRIDLAAEGVKRVYSNESDSLAFHLSAMFKDASKAQYNQRLNAAYRNKNRGFMLTPRKVDYTELQKIKKFPILRRGRFGGGVIIEQENKRITPLGMLALRTIGGLNKGAYGGVHGPIGYTGLEDAYEPYLKGKDGISYKQNLSGRWVTRTEIEPEAGMDIITTINVKMQDIAENALNKQLHVTKADWATVILMEVKTGKIKAIANLGKGKDEYYEKDNYALGARGCYEPGSTFKLVSLMVALEDGVVDTSDVFDTGNGAWYSNGRTIKDSHGYGKLTVKQIFEKSSNIGTAMIITSNYANNPRDYVDRVYSFDVNKPLGLDLNGEGVPYFKYPGDTDWWGTTLGSMAYGYDSKMTPLQILNFYNAVANDGKMVKPQLVSEIKDNGALVKQFKPEILNPMIASKETIGKAQKMLEGVCLYGTGKTLNNKYFTIAGKTGTARVATGNTGYSDGMYLATFVGYFPADNPKYSMIVTFNNSKVGYYGATVAGPVFKEVSEKIFALQGFIEESGDDASDIEKLPAVKKGKSEDILRIAEELNIQNLIGKPNSQMASVSVQDSTVILTDNEIQAGKVPNVKGMGASNAIFLMENAGLKVKVKGIGKVKKQSLVPGSNYRNGQTVYLTLS